MRVEGVWRSVLLTGLIVTLLASAAPLPAQEGREALDRHIEWLGGAEAWRAVAGLRMSGTLAVAGLQGSLVVTVHRDGYQRTEYDLEVVEGVEGVTPEDAWEINPSGQVETMGADKAAPRNRADFPMAPPGSRRLRGLLPRSGGEGRERVGGGPLRVSGR